MKIASSLVVAVLFISISVLADQGLTDEVSDALAKNLWIMAGRGDTDAVRKILDEGADVNATDEAGYTALDYAVGVSLKFSGTTDLDYALEKRLAMVRLLLVRGANANSQPPGWGSTPLMAASYDGNLDIVRELLAHKADANLHSRALGDTALIGASGSGYLDIVKELLAHGAKIKDQNNAGRTALAVATAEGNRDIITYLKQHGAGRGGRWVENTLRIVPPGLTSVGRKVEYIESRTFDV